VVRTWTIYHTQSIVEVLDWVASKARRDDRAIASLTILVAIKASACIYIRILAEGADSSTNHLRHFLIVVNNLVGVLVLGIGRAFRVALAHKKLVCRIWANHAISIERAVAHFARWMASNGSYLNIVDLFSLEIGIISVIISYTSEEFDISEELPAVTLP